MLCYGSTGKQRGNPGGTGEIKRKGARRMNKLTGAEIVIECLKEQGVDTVLDIREERFSIFTMHFINIQDKSPYPDLSRAGGGPCGGRLCEAPVKVGVCMATSGPGATNLVTGIATAFMDSIPMVAITCNVGGEPSWP